MYMIPKFIPQEFGDLICRYQIQTAIGVPMYWEKFAHDWPNLQKKYNLDDLSFLKNPVSGGDVVSPEVTEKCNQTFKDNNSEAKFIVGYGSSETAGPVATTVNNDEYSDDLTTGIFFPGIKHIFLDPETHKVVEGATSGELALHDPGMMLGYLDADEETEEITVNYNGEKYYNMGDLFSINEKGMLYFGGRTKRVIMRPDGHTVHAFPIEKSILEDEDVENVCAVGLKKKDNSSGTIPVAFVVLKDGVEPSEELVKRLDTRALFNLSERNRAMAYTFVQELPYSLMGKIAYKELEKITNLSYEEMVETMAKCQKDDVAVIASEFKKGYQKDENGNYIVDDELGNKKSVSKMKSITKANRKIQSYTKFQSKYPNILNGFTNRKISKWNEVYDKAINRHEGARYNLIFNKRQVGYMADRIADIKSKRIGITKEEFYNEHPEAKEAVEKAIEKGLDLNTEELGEWAKEFVNEGNTDISNFKDDYLIHTVTMEEYTNIYKDLDNNIIPYGVELNKSIDGKTDTVRVYIHSEDLEQYQKAGHLDKGVLQSYGKRDNKTKIYNVTRKEEKETKDIILPRSSMEHYISMFKGKDFVINLNGNNEKNFVARMTLDEAKEVLAYQKKRNPVQEKLDEIRREKELNELENKINEIEQAEKSQSGEEISKTVQANNIEKVPAKIEYDSLSREIKDNLKEVYKFDNDSEAKDYFDNNCQIELGTDKNDRRLGVIVTEKSADEESKYFIYSNEQEKRILLPETKENSEEKIIDNKNDSTDVSDTIEDKDMEMDIDAD